MIIFNDYFSIYHSVKYFLIYDVLIILLVNFDLTSLLKFISMSVNTYFESMLERSKLQKTLPFQLGRILTRVVGDRERVVFPLLFDSSYESG